MKIINKKKITLGIVEKKFPMKINTKLEEEQGYKEM